jgi:hypothetical protein
MSKYIYVKTDISHKASPSFVIVDKIKCEARLWIITGAKRLSDLMPGE